MLWRPPRRAPWFRQPASAPGRQPEVCSVGCTRLRGLARPVGRARRCHGALPAARGGGPGAFRAREARGTALRRFRSPSRRAPTRRDLGARRDGVPGTVPYHRRARATAGAEKPCLGAAQALRPGARAAPRRSGPRAAHGRRGWGQHGPRGASPSRRNFSVRTGAKARTGGAHLLEGRDAEAVCETSKSQRFPAPLGTETSKFRSGAQRRKE